MYELFIPYYFINKIIIIIYKLYLLKDINICDFIYVLFKLLDYYKK